MIFQLAQAPEPSGGFISACFPGLCTDGLSKSEVGSGQCWGPGEPSSARGEDSSLESGRKMSDV